jgi:phosphate transport system substrate-binding protein
VRRIRKFSALAAAGAVAIGAAACGGDDGGGGSSDLKGKIAIDGSSTVLPFAQAAAELFNEENPDVRITVGSSGTGGGFEKFCAGETDVSDASRPITSDEEVPVCRRNGVRYSEVQVANDGIAVVTNQDLRIDCMTVDQLRRLWNKGSSVRSYNEVDPQFPNTPVKLFGPGTDSGTFDFFTDEINGEEGVSRSDYEPSEDDNVIVEGVSGTAGGLGYFGFSYYEQAQGRLNLVGVGESSGSCVKPSTQTIQNGSYKPLSRPLFMYVSQRALQRPEVKAFMEFVVQNQAEIGRAAQIVPLTSQQQQKARQALTAAGG